MYRNKHREVAELRRQRNMTQMKGQIKTPEEELNKMEIHNLSDAEFKTLFIRMLKKLNEDLNCIKKIQSKMKDTVFEIRNNLQETTIEWMKPRIKSMIWNIRKQKKPTKNKKQTDKTPQNHQNSKRKKESKKMKIL